MSRYPSLSSDRSVEHLWIATGSGRPMRVTTTDAAHTLAHLPTGWRALAPEEIPDDQQQQTDVAAAADTAAD